MHFLPSIPPATRYLSPVNFFGHLAAALQVSDDLDFLLGAMAPDLLSLSGAQAGTAVAMLNREVFRSCYRQQKPYNISHAPRRA